VSPFPCLLQLTRLQWWYSNLPPHGGERKIATINKERTEERKERQNEIKQRK
jgi:hypothetical protein